MRQALSQVCGVERRGSRVGLLLLGVIVLSLGDMALTLAHLRSIGMVEANPVAAYVITSTASVWPLVIYKCSTVAICVGVLFRIRQRIQAEIGAWICLFVLVALTVHWHQYSAVISEPEVSGAIADGNVDDRWITIVTD